MCIIAIKPVGVKLPDETILRNMWDNNPDGAGFMYADKTGHVQIRKGFMKWKSFKRNIDSLADQMDLTNTPLIMHFRITTHGGTCPGNTHPFPVTDDVKTLGKTSVVTGLGVAHNGIISSVTPRKGLSDTGEYIVTQLAPLKRAMPRFYENKDAMLMVKNAIGSKMAFLTGAGEIYTIGDFTADDGMLYSNTTYRFASFRDYKWSKYDGDAYDSKTRTITPAVTFPKTGYRWLMPLLDGDYVILPGGEMIEGYYEYAIDKDGRVYAYDYDYDGSYRIDGAEARNAAGLPLRYRYENAEPTVILDEPNT